MAESRSAGKCWGTWPKAASTALRVWSSSAGHRCEYTFKVIAALLSESLADNLHRLVGRDQDAGVEVTQVEDLNDRHSQTMAALRKRHAELNAREAAGCQHRSNIMTWLDDDSAANVVTILIVAGFVIVMIIRAIKG